MLVWVRLTGIRSPSVSEPVRQEAGTFTASPPQPAQAGAKADADAKAAAAIKMLRRVLVIIVSVSICSAPRIPRAGTAGLRPRRPCATGERQFHRTFTTRAGAAHDQTAGRTRGSLDLGTPVPYDEPLGSGAGRTPNSAVRR